MTPPSKPQRCNDTAKQTSAVQRHRYVNIFLCFMDTESILINYLYNFLASEPKVIIKF
jgi:hypothetical protein